MSQRRLHRPTVDALLVLAAGAGLVLTAVESAVAQSGRQRMVFVNESDGAPPEVVHFSMPDMQALRQPDYVRADLRHFNEILRLDDLQKPVVASLLDEYVGAFRDLLKTSLPEREVDGIHFGPGGGPMTLDLAPAGDGESFGDLLKEALGGRDGNGPQDVDIDFNGPGEVAIMIEAGGSRGGFGGAPGPADDDDVNEDSDPGVEFGEVIVSGGGDEDGDGEPTAGVMIRVAGADDVEIPEELMKKLEQKAREMAEKLQEQMDENEAQGLDPLAGAVDPHEMIEQRRRHYEELEKTVERLTAEKATLTKTFENDVREQLSLDQLERWPRLERTLTRHKTLPRGRLDGERTDLIEVFDQLLPTEAERRAAAEAIDRYELDLHRALVARNAFLADAETRIDDAIKAGKVDRATVIADRAANLRVAVRQVNHESAEAIAERLNDETRAAEFRQRVAERSFPRIHRPTRAAKAFDSVERLEGLDEETRATIGEWRAAFENELALTNAQIRTTVERHQPGESRKALEHVAAMMEGEGGFMHHDEDESDPIAEAFERRTALDEKYLDMLRRMLPPEQVAAMPELAPRATRRPMIIHRVGDGDPMGWEMER